MGLVGSSSAGYASVLNLNSGILQKKDAITCPASILFCIGVTS